MSSRSGPITLVDPRPRLPVISTAASGFNRTNTSPPLMERPANCLFFAPQTSERTRRGSRALGDTKAEERVEGGIRAAAASPRARLALCACEGVEHGCAGGREEACAKQAGADPPQQRGAGAELELGGDAAGAVRVHDDGAPVAGHWFPVERERPAAVGRPDPERLAHRRTAG